MHSKIFQISNTVIYKEDYKSPDTYIDNSGDFADYIGEEITGEDREDALNYLADLLKDVFKREYSDVFRYKGPDAMEKFKQAWADELRRQAGLLTHDNLFRDQNLFKIRKVTEETHLGTSYRVDIANWAEGVAYPFGELFEYAASQLKQGDCIYIGAIIDYHY